MGLTPRCLLWGFLIPSQVILFSHFSHVRLSVTPWTIAHQAPLSVGFSRQEYWSGLPFPSPEDLPSPGIEPMSPALTGGFFTSAPPGKPFLWLVQFTIITLRLFISTRLKVIPFSSAWNRAKHIIDASTLINLNDMKDASIMCKLLSFKENI